MMVRGFVRWSWAVALFVSQSAVSAPKVKSKGKGMEAELVRIDAKGNVTIDKGVAAGVVKGCAVYANAHVREVLANKGTAVIYLAKSVTEVKRSKSLDLVCGKAKIKATIVRVELDLEKGARVVLGGLKGKRVASGCTHSFRLGRVERVYERASVVPTSMGDVIATQKAFWIECP